MTHTASRFVALLSAAALLFTAGCEQPPAPSGSQDSGITQGRPGGPPPQAATEGQINQLLNGLVPPSEHRSVNPLFARMKSEISRGDVAAAQDAMFELVDLLLRLHAGGELLDPKGPQETGEALLDLLDLLFEFVGLTAPSSNQDLEPILSGQVDGAVGVVGPGGGTVVTDTKFAGVEFPQNAVDDEILVIIQRDDVANAEDCLPTPLLQAEGCYLYDTEPAIGDVNQGDSFNVDVIVGICLDPGITGTLRDQFLLHKFDPENPQDGVVPLPSANEGFLDCAGFQASLPSTWWGELAQQGWDELQGSLSTLLGPRPLRATNLGLGGSVGSFSRFGWVQAGTLTIESGDGQSGSVGDTLSDFLEVKLETAHDDPPSSPAVPIQDVLVEFEIRTGGGGLNADANQTGFVVQTTDTTGVAGVARARWQLGSTVGSQKVVARVSGAQPDSVVFTANGIASVQWQSVGIPTSGEILDIWALGNDTLWVTTGSGEILRSGDSGSSWAFTQPAGFGSLWGVWGTGSDTTWVVGEDAEQLFTTDGGATWTNALSGQAGVDTAYSVWGTDVDSVFVAGTDSVHFATGFATTKVLSTQAAGSFREVWGLNPVVLWAVGTDGSVGEVWLSTDEGNNWSLETPANTPDAALYWSVWGTAMTDVFAVGEDAQAAGGLVAHEAGAGWFRVATTSAVLRDVHGTGPSNAYAVGDAGTVLRYDGTNWFELPPPTAAGLRAVWVTPDGTVWVGGTGGTLLRGTP